MKDLTTFCDHMIETATEANQHFTAETVADIKAELGQMKNDVAHSHLLRMRRELTEAMDASPSPIAPEHGVAWSQRCIVDQCIRWMQGELVNCKIN